MGGLDPLLTTSNDVSVESAVFPEFVVVTNAWMDTRTDRLTNRTDTELGW